MVARRALLGGAAKLAAFGGALAAVAACAPSGGALSGQASAPAAKPSGGEAPAKPSGPLEKIELAFCSQVLCVLPYEVARQRGFWAAEGLDVELVYMRGGTQAINA